MHKFEISKLFSTHSVYIEKFFAHVIVTQFTYQSVLLDGNVCIDFYPLRQKCMFMHWTCFCFGPRTKVNLQMYAKLRHAIIDIQVSPAKRKSESSQQANKRKGACSCRFRINKSQSSCKAPILQVKMLVLVGVMSHSTHSLPLG